MTDTEAADAMSPVEFAAYRHLLGLSARELAEILDVRVTTVQDWESGRRGTRPSPWAASELRALVAEHTDLAERMAATEGSVQVSRDPDERGWLVAAAARALIINPAQSMEWATTTQEEADMTQNVLTAEITAHNRTLTKTETRRVAWVPLDITWVDQARENMKHPKFRWLLHDTVDNPPVCAATDDIGEIVWRRVATQANASTSHVFRLTEVASMGELEEGTFCWLDDDEA